MENVNNKIAARASRAMNCYVAPKQYRTILADPPWHQEMRGNYANRPKATNELPYSTMTLEEIKNLPVGDMADVGCHLWLWTTNQYLEAGFDVMRAWGFKYLAPITWVKPQGMGNYFQHRTQTLLFGYKQKCVFPLARYKPTVFFANIGKHSQKPRECYDLIEGISDEPRLELFARPASPMFPKLPGWDTWGNEIDCDVSLSTIVT